MEVLLISPPISFLFPPPLSFYPPTFPFPPPFHSRESGNLFPRMREIPRSGSAMSPAAMRGGRCRPARFPLSREWKFFNFAPMSFLFPPSIPPSFHSRPSSIPAPSFHSRESGNLFPRMREIPRSGSAMSPTAMRGGRCRPARFPLSREWNAFFLQNKIQ